MCNFHENFQISDKRYYSIAILQGTRTASWVPFFVEHTCICSQHTFHVNNFSSDTSHHRTSLAKDILELHWYPATLYRKKDKKPYVNKSVQCVTPYFAIEYSENMVDTCRGLLGDCQYCNF